jgi:predicted lipid-binding transport protein (Tim44 family)
MPTDILIYAIIAAVMVFWLKNVIGTRHGDERERPNPFDEKNMADESKSQAESNVTHLGSSVPTGEKSNTDTPADAGLVQIALADKSFDPTQFKDNAADAFSMIVMAFADGDRDTLRDLCNDVVYKAFDNAIRTREKAGETVATEIHAVRKTDIVAAGVESKRHAFVTLKFTADETYVISDKHGDIIAGHPERVTEMTDQWTFTRDVKSSDPRWLLSKTEDDVIEEDGKTPLPDAG